jgi:hypothetical protein
VEVLERFCGFGFVGRLDLVFMGFFGAKILYIGIFFGAKFLDAKIYEC